MLRRVGVVLTSAAVMFAALSGASVAHAYGKKPVAATGAILCDVVTGTIKLKPKFVNGGTTPGLVKFNADLGNCRDDSGDEGPVPAGITGGKLTGSFTTPTNACTAMEAAVGGAGTATIKWTGAQKILKSTFTSDDSGYQFDSDGNYFSLPADYQHAGGDVMGSFNGGTGQILGNTDEGGTPIAIACTPKTKGLHGSGGLKKLALNTQIAVLISSPAAG